MPFDNVRLALDRSVRSYDQDGRLHVAVSHLTKACVNQYRGSEIPNFQQLGLDANRVYNLLRHPGELQKAARTFNNIQILDQHIPVTAADDQRPRVIGSTGTDAAWRPPYIDNSLVFWSDPAIAMIESGQMKELSSGYRYDAVMQPGVYMSDRYDGVMTNIRANHIALVEAGRAGSDVVVMDSKPKEIDMKLSPRAAYMMGSTAAYVAPFLAQDKKMPDLVSIFAPVTTQKTWESKRQSIEAALARALKPVLAQDAEVHIHEHLDGAGAGAPPDSLMAAPAPGGAPDGGGGLVVNGAAGQQTGAAPVADPTADPNAVGGGDDDLAAKVQQLLQGQIDDNDLAIILHALKQVKPPPAPADPAAPPAKPDASGGGDPPPKKDDGGDSAGAADEDDGVAEKLDGLAMKDTPAMDNKPVTKVAMDAAIKKAIEDTTTRLNARDEAKRFVRPWVGDIAVAMDSAAEVYKLALEQCGEDVSDIHPSAYKALLSRIPRPGEQASRPIAMDRAAADQYLKRFPNANRLQSH
jgi:hypothetical protein